MSVLFTGLYKELHVKDPTVTRAEIFNPLLLNILPLKISQHFAFRNMLKTGSLSKSLRI